MAKAVDLLEKAADCRHLAKRARRLAGTFIDGPDRPRILQHAEELEARAVALEKKVAAMGGRVAPHRRGVRIRPFVQLR